MQKARATMRASQERLDLARHIHILGICGTFMGGLALLARELGYSVSGSDANVYPPMSTQLTAAGIDLMEGYLPEHLAGDIDEVIVGNALSRGNPAVEHVLERGMPYTSGPAWLAEHVLQEKWVLAVSGTHGKTTTSSMLASLLEHAGMTPGFLIGGIPGDFGISARLGDGIFFVVEADEYDSAFFDKRSKFVHYRPRTLVINNLEFDHADIFTDLAAIQRQFHHLVRTVPGNGVIIRRSGDVAVEEVLSMGCWTPVQQISCEQDSEADWQAVSSREDGSAFSLRASNPLESANVEWEQCGRHNLENGLAAAAAAHHVGVTLGDIATGLESFSGVKRRLEVIGQIDGVTVYDDFAHHPTAISTTLEGLRAHVGDESIVALIEPRSATMRQGAHRDALAPATAAADKVLWFEPPGMDWSMQAVVDASPVAAAVCTSVEEMVDVAVASVFEKTHIVVMSNGGFDGIHIRLLAALEGTDGAH